MRTQLPFIAISLFLGSLATISAQNFGVDRFSIDGGGGAGSGGSFSINGSIGAFAGASSGGPYEMTGGFWSVIGVVQSSDAPLLQIEKLSGGSVRIFWLLPAAGFVLEKTSALAPLSVGTQWDPVLFPYTTNSTQISITVSAPGNGFYRLRRP
jgi:hypothetical protein